MSADTARHHAARMTREAWVLFAAMSVIWGLPYLFIKLSVVELTPAAVVLGRTVLAALVLVPVAALGGALGPALRAWRVVALFAVLEMAVPWLLLGHAEQRISSALAGLMLAMVPIVGALATVLLGERHNVARVRLVGMALGVLGVAGLVGLDATSGYLDWLSVVELLVVAVCYAVAPIVIDRQRDPPPALGVIALSVLMVAVVYVPWGLPGFASAWPLLPATAASVAALGLVCTALAFVLFFRLIAVAGPVRAVTITFVNPAVAIVLGVLVLAEPFTAGMLVGFPLVLAGSWLATRPSRGH
jgi:drug/metabolite transporter (DMT)-like permease